MSRNGPTTALFIVGLASLSQVASSPGQTYLVGLFGSAFQNDLALSASSVSAGYLLGTLASAALQVRVGRSSDRWGPLPIMMGSALLLGLVCVAMRWVSGWLSLTLAFFLLRLFGQGALSLTSGHALALHFRRRLGLVEGVRLAAIGIAMACVPAWIVQSIQRMGWRSTYALLGVSVWLLVLPAAIVVQRLTRTDGSIPGEQPRQPSQDLSEAAKTPAYWLLLATAVAHPTVATALIFHLSALSGPTQVPVEALLAIFGGVSTVATLLGGRLADRFSPRSLLMMGTAGLGLAAFVGSLESALGLHWTMVVLALGTALHSTTLGPAVARTFGPTHHGALRSSLASAGIAGSSVGPLILGVAQDYLGTMAPGLWLLAAGSLAVAVAYQIAGASLARSPKASVAS